MSILEITYLSIIQGITEWLPVSSSGHLVLVENWLKIKEASLGFDIFLHLASLLVIIIFFRDDIIKVIKSFFNKKDDNIKNWIPYILLSTIFTGIIGYIFYLNINSFRTTSSVSDWLLITAMLLFTVKFSKQDKHLNWKHASILGIVQGFAVLPGLSRSGVVIATALIMGVYKKEAFVYSFLLAIPAILAASIISFKSLIFSWYYLLGFGITILVGYLALVILKSLIKKDYFYLFFIYTLILSLIIKFI